MSKKVKIRVTSTAPYHIPGELFASTSLRDTTGGKVYDAVLYERGEVDSEGDRCTSSGVLFKDDKGDSVYSFVGGGWEVIDE